LLHIFSTCDVPQLLSGLRAWHCPPPTLSFGLIHSCICFAAQIFQLVMYPNYCLGQDRGTVPPPPLSFGLIHSCMCVAAQIFRLVMYPNYGSTGGGLLRLHSTYRHDFKIYSSDEGRVQVGRLPRQSCALADLVSCVAGVTCTLIHACMTRAGGQRHAAQACCS
jgi:hypothetical protein